MMLSPRPRRYGWLPDLPDQRDHAYRAPAPILAKLPTQVDLRPQCPAVLHQGELGSCTAHAVGNAFWFGQRKQGLHEVITPSRLFLYYNARLRAGTVKEDAGAMLRDGIKALAKQGVCDEVLWPYRIERFAQKPPAKAYRTAQDHQLLSYRRLTQTLAQMKGCLASGYPFVFGFSVYESFETASVTKTGRMPMPDAKETMLGGHAVLAVGYSDARKTFTIMNSWSTAWGDQGYFHMPYDFITQRNLAADFWTMRLVEGH